MDAYREWFGDLVGQSDQAAHASLSSVPAVFDALGGPSAVGRILSVGASTASEMKRRRSIPPEYWVEIITAAGRPDLTYETLALIHARPKGRIAGALVVPLPVLREVA